MKAVHLVTAAWGNWHLEALLEIMWPTALSDGNLTALSRKLRARYIVQTTREGAHQILAHPATARVRQVLPGLEIRVMSDQACPPPHEHLNWWRQAAVEAREQAAWVAYLPPDVAWPDPALGNLAEAILGPYDAVTIPYQRVLSETFVPEVRGMAVGGKISLEPHVAVQLSIRHLHPLGAALILGSPHGHPTLELWWPVPGEGLILRHMVRELSAFDPQRIEPTSLIYTRDLTDLSRIKVVRDSDDMVMLSLAPFLKDVTDRSITVPGTPVNLLDPARNSLHPDNDTPWIDAFSRISVRWKARKVINETLWKKVEAEVEEEFGQAIRARALLQELAKATGPGQGVSDKVVEELWRIGEKKVLP